MPAVNNVDSWNHADSTWKLWYLLIAMGPNKQRRLCYRFYMTEKQYLCLNLHYWHPSIVPCGCQYWKSIQLKKLVESWILIVYWKVSLGWLLSSEWNKIRDFADVQIKLICIILCHFTPFLVLESTENKSNITMAITDLSRSSALRYPRTEVHAWIGSNYHLCMQSNWVNWK